MGCHRFRLGLFAFVLSLTAPAAAEEVSLRPQVEAQGPFVTLGDLFEHAGAAAATEVAPAPEPGARGLLSVAAIAAAARAHGLTWTNQRGLRHIAVTRASEEIPAETIEETLRTTLEERIGGGPIALRLIRTHSGLYVAAGAPLTVRVDGLDLDPQSGRFTATLAAPAEDPDAATMRVNGVAEPAIEVPVLAQPLAPDAVITAADLDWIALPQRRLGRAIVTTAEALIGMTPRRHLVPGRPVRLGDVARPVVVKKGASVTMFVALPGMSLTAIGRAQADGGLGETIPILNPRSHRTVEAEVIGPDRVRVPLSSPAPHLALAQP